MATLGGATFIYNGNKFDYNYRETIQHLKDFCDQVCVVVIRSDDGTVDEVKKFEDERTKIIVMDETLWNMLGGHENIFKGRERLSHFSNIAIANLDTDFVLYCQCDEVIHENSFPYIRQAISEPDATGFMIKRINLWGDPYHELIAPNQPCSIEVIRLGRNQPSFRCVDDGESLSVLPLSFKYVDKIVMYHMGYVRNFKIMKAKVHHMLTDVFQFAESDKKLDECEVYNPWAYFTKEQVRPLTSPLPKCIESWAEKRFLINQTYDTDRTPNS